MEDHTTYSTLMILLGALWIFFGVPELYRDFKRRQREQRRSRRATNTWR